MKKYLFCFMVLINLLFLSGCEELLKDNFLEQCTEISQYIDEKIPNIVTSDIDLTKQYDKYNATIEWRSSNTTVISNDGKVSINDNEAFEVSLTYIIKIKDKEKIKDRNIIVSGLSIDDISSAFEEQFGEMIKSNIDVNNTFLNIFKVDWESSEPSLFNNEGEYNSPTEDTNILISYYIVCGNYKSEKKYFDILVCGEEYIIKVVNGLINDESIEIVAKANEEIMIKANKKEGYDFLKWTDSKGNVVSDEEKIVIKVTKSDTYIANYTKQPVYHRITVINGLINNEVTTGSYQEKSNIILTANDKEGYNFVSWTDANGKVVSSLKTFTLNVMGENTYTANYVKQVMNYYISVVNGKINYYSTSGKFQENSNITLQADERAGYNFVNWTDLKGNVVSTNKTFILTVAGDNTYTANYKEIVYYNINVVDGLINGIDLSGRYSENSNITIEASEKDGYDFINWTDSKGVIVSTNKSINIKVIEDNTYTANYKEKEKIIVNEHSEFIEASYDSTISTLALPSSIQIKNNDQTYIISVKWIINNFKENKIGKQEFTGEVTDTSVLVKNNIEIKSIKLVIDVLPYTLELNTNKTYTITRYYGNEEKVEIPNTFNNITITNIAQKAFNENLSIKELVIPNTITLIEQGAIYFCDNIESITIPFVGRSKEDYYSNYTLFGYIFGSDDYKTQKNYVPLKLEKVVLLEGTLEISGLAFYECSTIKTIDLPSTVKTIEYHAFYNCTSLIDFEIPEGVTQLGDGAFAGCSSLEKVTIPKGVTVISNQLFAECTKLKEIIIHNEVTNIEFYAFKDCTSLMNIEIPESVLSIASGVFSGCESLVIVKLPSKLRYIESSTFSMCKSLNNIDIPESVIMINSSAFWHCESLNEIKIPKNVTSIGEDAFIGCENLRIIINESNMNFVCGSKDYGKIAYYAYKVVNKEKINYKGGTYSYEYIIQGDFKFLYHSNDYDIFKYYLISYMGSEEIPIIPVNINGNIYSCKYMDETLKNIELSNEFKTIHSGMFNSCRYLETVVVPNSVIKIEQNAFYCCDFLKSILIPNSVEYVYSCAISSCYNVTINCVAQSKPSGWASSWNSYNYPVIWGYNSNN